MTSPQKEKSSMTAPKVLAALKKWRSAIKERGRRSRPEFVGWEGDKAYANLKGSGMLSLALLEPTIEPIKFQGWQDFRTENLVKHLSKITHRCVHLQHSIREINEHDRIRKEQLASMQKWLKLAARSCSSFPGLHCALMKSAQLCSFELRELAKNREKRWKGLYGAWQVVLDEPRHRKPLRNIDLDGWFQIQLAALLRTALPESSGVSLRTISRLVVLFHACVGLAEYDSLHGCLVSVASKRRLTVDAVDQKLRAAGFPKLTLLDSEKAAPTDGDVQSRLG